MYVLAGLEISFWLVAPLGIVWTFEVAFGKSILMLQQTIWVSWCSPVSMGFFVEAINVRGFVWAMPDHFRLLESQIYRCGLFLQRGGLSGWFSGLANLRLSFYRFLSRIYFISGVSFGSESPTLWSGVCHHTGVLVRDAVSSCAFILYGSSCGRI